MKKFLYTCLLITGCLLAGNGYVYGQEFRVASNRMVVVIPAKISQRSLDSFLTRYNLAEIGIEDFVLRDDKKMLLNNGWRIDKEKGRDRDNEYRISKSLAISADLRKPLDKPYFNQIPTRPEWQQREGNKAIFGVNEFKSNRGFRVHDSIVDFFLRGFKHAERVRLAGSFTDWQHGAFPMTQTDSGWIAHVKLVPGKYYYKFIVDEGDWTTDPDNFLEENDGQGNTNSVFYVTNHLFNLDGNEKAQFVFLSGSFNGWSREGTRMYPSEKGWTLNAFLGEGTYAYQFIINGKATGDTILYASGNKHRFMVTGNRNAKNITIEGDFNNWKHGGTPMKPGSEGWKLDYALGPGNYTWHAKIDGVNQPDSFLVIGANYTFRLNGFRDAQKVYIAGDFNNWNPQNVSMHQVGGEWICSIYLAPGKHLYKFIVDGKWIRDPKSRQWEDDDNAVIWINEEE